MIGTVIVLGLICAWLSFRVWHVEHRVSEMEKALALALAGVPRKVRDDVGADQGGDRPPSGPTPGVQR